MRFGQVVGLLCGCSVLAVGWSGQPARAAGEPEGYLSAAQSPDAARLLGPPPAQGSGTWTGDVTTYHTTRKLQGTDRWALASRDAAFGPGVIMQAFSCSLGVSLTPRNAPALYHLLDRLTADTEGAEHSAKQIYRRPRPFVAEPGAICVTPETWLKTSYSYPSGHSTFAWAAGLVVQQIAPDRGSDVLARARSYGESRVVCGVHYQSDVQAGREVGAAVFGALQANPAFKADLTGARVELARLRAAPPAKPDAGECRIEADASAHPIW